MHMSVNRVQCDAQLHGCPLGHMVPEHPKTLWPVVEDFTRCPGIRAWKSALSHGLRLAGGFRVLSTDGTMNVGMGLRAAPRRTTWPHNTCVLTIRTLHGAVLDLAVVSKSKPNVVAGALEGPAHPEDRVASIK